MTDKLALSLREVAEALGVSYGTVFQYVRNGTLPGRKLGDRWLVSKAQLEAWLDSKMERAADCQ